MAPEQSGKGVDAQDSRADLGVLFVHGIGSQKQGQTLVQFADPVARWFARWLTRGDRSEPSVAEEEGSQVILSGAELSPSDGPPRCLMTIFEGSESESRQTRWLLAESWWAETFEPPSTLALLRWLLLVMPYLVLVQFDGIFRRGKRENQPRKVRVVRKVIFFVLFACSLPLAAIGAAALALLLVALVAPIDAVNQRAKQVALLFASTIGDSYVLISSSVQFDAMVTKVASDIAWLSEKAECVAVVAHSQGAAVSYHALRARDIPKEVDLFVTVGQGLSKLELVRQLQTYGGRRATVNAPALPKRVGVHNAVSTIESWWNAIGDAYRRVAKLRTARFALGWVGLIGVYAVAYSAPQAVFLFHDSSQLVAMLAILGVGLVMVLLVMHMCDRHWYPDVSSMTFSVPRPDGSLVDWADFYASADPVSNGPLFETDGKGWPKDREVWNRASFLTDHTTYAQSEDDFLGCLAKSLAARIPGTQPGSVVHADFTRTRWRAWWRVWWLEFSRVVIAVAGVVTVWRIWGHLSRIGTRVDLWAHWHWLRSLGKAVLGGVRALVVVGNPSNRELAGFLVVVIVLAAGYALVAGTWLFWEKQDVKRFYRRLESDTDPLGGRELIWFLCSQLLLIAVAVSVAYTGDYAAAWNWCLDHLLATVGIVLAAVLAGPLLSWLLRPWLRDREKSMMKAFPRTPPEEHAPETGGVTAAG